MTFRCTVTGLDPDETANEIEFGHLPKFDHNQLQTNEINIIDPNYTNGTIGELHIPNANASHNGDYHCRVKIHTKPPNECMLVKTPVKTVDIEDDVRDPVPPTDSDSTNTTVKNAIIGIIVTVMTITIVVLIVLLFISVRFNVKKCKRKQQVHNQPELERSVHNQPELEQSVHNQPELEQSVEVEEHVQEHLPLLQSKNKTHWYINASTKVCMCAHYYREYRQVQHYSQKFLPATERIFTLLFWPLLS